MSTDEQPRRGRGRPPVNGGDTVTIKAIVATEMAEWIEQYAERNKWSSAQVVRNLLERGRATTSLSAPTRLERDRAWAAQFGAPTVADYRATYRKAGEPDITDTEIIARHVVDRGDGTISEPEGQDGPSTMTTPSEPADLVAEDATPAEIMTALTPPDRDIFRVDYERAIDTARTSLDLTELHTMLDQWRGVALLQADPDDYDTLIRSAAERLTGTRPGADESLDSIRARVGL